MDDLISRQAAINMCRKPCMRNADCSDFEMEIMLLPSVEPKRGKWILDRSGAYCCSECMEPCAGYVMMRPRDKYCKMCGAKMEVTT